jgi:hypothetical protein
MLPITLALTLAAAAPAQLVPAPFLVGEHVAFRCVCPPAERRPVHDIVLLWNNVTLNAIRAEQTPPPIAARNLAMVHLAIYDAVNAVYLTHQPFYVRPAAPAETSPAAAAAVAGHRTLIGLYPKYREDLDTALNDCLATVAESTAKHNGIRVGQAVAEKILDWRSPDFAQARSAYALPSDPGRWQRTPPDYQAPLLPEWRKVSAFALRDPAVFRPSGPPALSSEAYAADFRQVKELGAINSSVRTADQTVIAKFWADGAGTDTPPGHWNRIAQSVALERKTSLAENARLFALLNVAMADAAIACWDCKYGFGFWRPVTAIRAAGESDWTPLLPTPPFPSYTSGHSSFSGAAAAALAVFFGRDDVRFTTTADGVPGVMRVFNSFSSAAAEAGMSRIYGGIHWDFDNRDGLASGRAVGEDIGRHHFQPLNTSSDGRRETDTVVVRRGSASGRR